MMQRALAVAGALAAGAVVSGGSYWLFLNTPESNRLMLGVSALLLLVCALAAALSINTAVLLANSAPIRLAALASIRGIGWFVVVATLLVGGWWLVAGADRWIVAHDSEINAWFIASLGWADVSWLMAAQRWASLWLRWAILPLAALSLLAVLLGRQRRKAAVWARNTWRWQQLAIVTLVFLLLFIMPWQLTSWRPSLPVNWLQPAAAAARLVLAFALMLSGATVLVLAAARPHDRIE